MFTYTYANNNQRSGKNVIDFTQLSDKEIDEAIHHVDDEPVAFDPFSLFAARMDMAQS